MASFEGDPPVAVTLTALPDRKELALVAVERTRMPMVVTDPRQPDNPVVLANGAFLELTGYTSAEVLGRNCRFLQGPDTDLAKIDAIRKGMEANADHISVELLNYRKDGSSFWNQLSISPVMNEAGELIYYFGSQKDITARRRAEQMEATERLLLMEVDHRAINVLALVQGILRLSQADTVDAFSSTVQGRIDALARAHRLLSESGWASADLGQLVAGETPAEATARVVASGSPLQIPAHLVQPLALVVHELMSNAARHGALACQRGKVFVTWAERSRQLYLDWQESGLTNLTSPPEPGFGLRLLDSVINQQLGGRVVTSWDSRGFRAEIVLPARA
jgi:PAS domain S-box-containing protein